jgi:cell division protease FtsH
MMLGGLAADEIIYGQQTTGAANDIEKATKRARDMVTKYGMSDLGPIYLNGDHETSWIAKQMGDEHTLSPDMMIKIDKEVEKIIMKQLEVAKNLIKKHKDDLARVVDILLEQETIDGDEFIALIDNTANK